MMAAGAPAGAAPTCEPPVYNPADHCKTMENGKVILQCTLQADHHLGNCSVKSEDPPGIGLGAAAMKMSTGISMPADAPQPAGSVLNIPIRFKAEK